MFCRFISLVCFTFFCQYLIAQGANSKSILSIKLDSVHKEYLLLLQLFKANLEAKKKHSSNLKETCYLEYLNDSGVTALVLNAQGKVINELTYKWNTRSRSLIFEGESNSFRSLTGYEDTLYQLKVLIYSEYQRIDYFDKENQVIIAVSPFKVYSIYLPETEMFVPIGNDFLYEINKELNIFKTIKYHDRIKELNFKPANSNREVKILGFRMDKKNSMIFATDILKFKHYTEGTVTTNFFVYLLDKRGRVNYNSVSDTLFFSDKHPLIH